MSKFAIKIIVILITSSLLTACMSLGNLTHKQAKMLKKEGFELTEEGWSLGLPEKLLFQFNDSQIQANQKNDLQRLSNQLLKYNLQKVKIIGHTDDIGNAQYNLALSEKRAEAVKAVFTEKGYQANNIITIGRGSTQPITLNNSETNRAINRRVNIIIIP